MGPGSRKRESLGERFAQSAMASELTRTHVLIGLLVFAGLILMFRLLNRPGQTDQWWITVVAVLVMTLYEGAIALFIRRMLAKRSSPRRFFWILNILIESLLPTFSIWWAWSTGLLRPDQAIAAPGAWLYAALILLSVLRLQTMLVVIGAVACSLQYFLLVALIRASGASEILAVVAFSYPTALTLFGAVAVFVAERLRVSVLEGLTEAAERERAEQEIGIAAKIQADLLPITAPDLAGFDISGWSVAAEQAGGDFFDWFHAPDGSVVVVLADVSGHGLGPAMIAVLCRAYARACSQTPDSLVDAVARVNRLIAADVPPGMFATCVIARLRSGGDEVELVSAGHGPILRIDARSGEVQILQTSGMPLGIDTDAEYQPNEPIRMNPGDGLVLSSDGIFERQRADSMQFGLERLKEVASRSRHDTAARQVQAIRSAADNFAEGAPAKDDVTIVVIRRAPV